MPRRFIVILLLLTTVVGGYAQSPIFGDFEVSQPAEPLGGFPALQQFMAVNLRKPFLAQAASQKGMVVLRGVVEPDGRMGKVTLLRPFRPDCDREALRVFALFNAWQPARKEGKPVRQQVVFPVPFGPNERVQYNGGVAVRYYDARLNAVGAADSSAQYRSEVATDTLGFSTGDLKLYRRRNSRWREEVTLPLSREPFRGGTLLLHRLPNLSAFGAVHQFDKAGRLRATYWQGPDGGLQLRLDRDERGMVTKRTQFLNGRLIETTWYPNGQLQAVRAPATPGDRPEKDLPEQLMTYRDSTGVLLISEGNGELRLRQDVFSMETPGVPTQQLSAGRYQNGLKQGLWTEKYADGSFWCEEVYDKGVLQAGRSHYAGGPDTLTYSVTEQPPQFIGGLPALSQFVATNLRFPPELKREGVPGRVMVSFMVQTDGTLGDVQVEQGVHPIADKEAIRLVNQMNSARAPRWLPAIQRGRPVQSRYSLPIRFSF